MGKGYFTLQTKDGYYYDFGKQCNYVDYSQSYICIFRKNNEENYLSLAAVPYDNISIIEWNKKEEEKELGE